MVKPKKHLGQHFLTDKNIAQKIVAQLQHTHCPTQVVEIGAGTGILTQYLLQTTQYQLSVVEIDGESVEYLQQHFPAIENRLIHTDFLTWQLPENLLDTPIAIIGNFPYNISSQIFFKILALRQQVPIVVGMIQKEVAERLASPAGSKNYGVLSVLLQAFYHIEYCFTVPPQVFNPPPKVQSAVVRLVRNTREKLDCEEKKFFQIVKQAFQQRRKTLRNALKSIQIPEKHLQNSLFDKRAEQLTVDDFITLTNLWNG